MVNRLFYTPKLTSSYLKEFNYNLSMTFQQALKSACVVSLADSQMLKTIRDVTEHKIDYQQLEEWIAEKDRLKKSKTKEKEHRKENQKRIQFLNGCIYDMMYIPEYISVVMDSKKHYAHMYNEGFYFNGVHYSRFSCSASQARVSTVIFIASNIKEECKKRLDNGRNLAMPLAPSKYNAYFGLYSSAIKEVTQPRFCIVKDYTEKMSLGVDYVVETAPDEDDDIEERTMDIEFNRFDGSGIIDPHFAQRWAEDLKIDYLPAQFCVRWSFTKGMVNVFDFKEFCNTEIPLWKQKDWYDEICDNGLLERLEKATGREYFVEDAKFLIQDVYDCLVDLRDVDVILSESQVKLYNAWPSQQVFEQCCKENGIVFGVTRPSPKKDKETVTTNYQFIQTLKLSDNDIEDLCSQTVSYINGVSLGSDSGSDKDIYYTLLFMLGENLNTESVEAYLKSSDNYWLKSLFVEHSLIRDRYSKEKIRDCIIRRIEQACLGKIIVQGNFQCIVPDNYAYMQHITGLPVVGLLKGGELYSDFWNKREVSVVDCMRSPMTHFSEHYVMNVVNNEQMAKWYKYSYSGIIVNTHDEHTMRFAGSDYDFDILATTSNKQFINGVRKNQRLVTYTPPKPKKILFTEDDLYHIDTFSFGNSIGSLTNIATTFIALLPLFKEGTKEHDVLLRRIKNCCCAQSKTIDRTKIGQEVKIMNTMWKTWQKITEEDEPEDAAKKQFANSLLAERKPYFMKYKYDDLKKQFNEYKKEKEIICKREFNMSLQELLALPKEELTEQQRIFTELFYKRLNIVDSPCEMNRVCRYIESVDFSIRQKMKTCGDFDYHVLMSDDAVFDEVTHKKVFKIMSEYLSEQETLRRAFGRRSGKSGMRFDAGESNRKELMIEYLRNQLEQACPDAGELTNYLVRYFYNDKRASNKNILWAICGPQMFKNAKSRHDVVYYPELTEEDRGDITFLYKKYNIKSISMNAIFQDKSSTEASYEDTDDVVMEAETETET